MNQDNIGWVSNKIALLGPYINSVSFQRTKLDIVKYYTNFLPVYNNVIILKESWERKNDKSRADKFSTGSGTC